mmetsp:Transcript_51934/g.168819  ORF Transcript_51934/g.168819 Transcript_51934/m.168819 type:complete len:204 (+) Transcript_51934:509-1120(+)
MHDARSANGLGLSPWPCTRAADTSGAKFLAKAASCAPWLKPCTATPFAQSAPGRAQSRARQLWKSLLLKIGAALSRKPEQPPRGYFQFSYAHCPATAPSAAMRLSSSRSVVQLCQVNPEPANQMYTGSPLLPRGSKPTMLCLPPHESEKGATSGSSAAAMARPGSASKSNREEGAEDMARDGPLLWRGQARESETTGSSNNTA